MPTTSDSYKNGKIYKIWSLDTDKIYIGSTCDTLSKRFYQHKYDYTAYKKGNKNKTMCSELFDMVGFERCRIDLVKNVICSSRNELEAEEGNVMRENKDIILNKNIVGRNIKQYYHDNKDKYIKNSKKRQKTDAYREYMREYMKKRYNAKKTKNSET